MKQVIGQMQDLMWQDVGIVRSDAGLKRAVDDLEKFASQFNHPKTRYAYEAQNIQTVGLLVARSALARKESRGAHYRVDFPSHDDAHYLKHSIVKGEVIRFE